MGFWDTKAAPPKAPATPVAKVAKYDAETAVYADKAKKANSFWGLAKGAAEAFRAGGEQLTKDVVKGTAEFALSAAEAPARLAIPSLRAKAAPPLTIPGLSNVTGPLESFETQAIKAREQGASVPRAVGEQAFNTVVNEPAGVALKPLFLAGGIVSKVGADAFQKLIAKGEGRIVQRAGEVISEIKDAAGKWVKATIEHTPSTTVATEKLTPIKAAGGMRTPEEIGALKTDVMENGIKKPIEVVKKENGTFEIADGNHRVGIASDAGVKDVPVIVRNEAGDALKGPELKKALDGLKTQKVVDAETHLEVIQDALRDHPGKGTGKFVNNFKDEFKKGGDSAYQDAVGQAESEGGDLAKLQKDREAYQALKVQETQAKQAVKDAKTPKPTITVGGKTVDLDFIHSAQGTDFFKTLSPEDQKAFATFDHEQSRALIPTEPKAPGKKMIDFSAPTEKPAALKTSAEGRPLALSAREKAIVEQSPAKAFEGGTGEARSLEQVARASREEVRLPNGEKPKTLDFIIEQTPVNKKVNLLDYLRTPDRVLKKIGLEPQAKQLRNAYDSYLKELPKNIDKIRAWAQTLPKDSSGRIFRYLDGEAITLNAPEQKVADEIQTWLKEWADRLKLPEDKRITNYITHIFDDQLIAKEFDEDLAKIITDKTPGEVYNPFLEARLGKLGYKQDVWSALEAYVKRATRKANMDPVLEGLKARVGSQLEFSNVEASQFKYIQRYMHGLNMRPTELDNLIDNSVKSIIGYRLGQRPLTRVTKILRQMTYRGLLGLNPGSALKNLSQGINTYATLGEKYTAIGYAKLFNPASYKELEREGVLAHGFIQDQTLSATKQLIEKADKGLFAFFETAERINRGAAYFGAKSQYLAKNPGAAEEKAVEYAKSVVRKTQFDFSPVDQPVALQSDLMKTLAQFQNFSLKQTEFLAEMAKNKDFVGLLRYALAGTAFVSTIGQAFGMKYTDLIPSFRFDTPASLKLPVEVGKAVLDTPDKYGQPRDLTKKVSDIGKAGIGLIPAGGQLKKTIEGAEAVSQGASTDKSGKVQFPVGGSKLKEVQALVFGKYASPEAQAYFNKAATPEEKAATETYDAVQKLVGAGKQDQAQAIVDGLSEPEYAAYKKMRAAGKSAQTTAAEQAMLPKVKEIQQLVKDGKTTEAQAQVDGFSDEEYRIYKLAKAKVASNDAALKAGGNKPESLVGDVVTYAKALGTDPVTAFNRIFTGQKILRLDNGTIIVARMPLSESEAVKLERGATTEMRLDHTIPLELGGSNSKDNLKLVSVDDWNSYTPVENYLGQQLRAGKLSKAQVQKLIQQFKDKEITLDEIKAQTQ